MKPVSLAVFVVFLLLIVGALQLMHYYPLMPERMATHFDASMEADGWENKRAFFMGYVIFYVLVIAALFTPVLLLKRIPPRWVNIPRREYWLAPERVEEAQRMLLGSMAWMTAATVAFMSAIAELSFRANLADGTPRLGREFFYILIGFIAAMALLSWRIYVQFSRVPRDPAASRRAIEEQRSL